MNNVTDLIQYLGEFEQGKLLMVLREECIEIIPRSSLMLYDVQLIQSIATVQSYQAAKKIRRSRKTVDFFL